MKIIFNIIYLFIFTTQVLCQEVLEKIEYGIPRIDNFETKKLGGESQNLDLIQDEKGVVIVANSAGFLIFNGENWKPFKPSNDGVPISFAKNNKKIYASGTEFIGCIEINEKGGYEFKDLTDRLPENVKLGFIWKTIYLNNKVYFQNDKNILVYSEDKFHIISDNSFVSGLFTHENEIYVNTAKGLYKIKGKKLDLISTYFSEKKIQIKGLIRTSNDKRYFLSTKNGIFLWNKDIKEDYSKLSSFFKENQFSTFKILNDGSFAFATFKGGLLLTDSILKPILRLTEKTGISSNNIRGIYQDYHSNIWLACQDGISKINYPYTSTFYNNYDENFGTVEEITNYREDIYIGTDRGTYKLNKITRHDLLSNNHYASFKKMLKSNLFNYANIVINDKLIYGGQNSSNVFDGKETKPLNINEPRKFLISKFHSNVVFMGHTFGTDILFFDKNTSISKIIKIDNFAQQVRGISEINARSLWLTTVSDGVYKVSFDSNFKNQKLTHFQLKDGLPSLRDNLVYTINNNNIVFTTHKGLYKFDESIQKFIPETRFGKKYAGGKEEFIYAFNFDKNQNVWMHSFRNQIATASIKDSLGNYRTFEKPLKAIGKMHIYEILSEPNKNVVWFGGSDGLARFDLNKVKTKEDVPFCAVISKTIGSNDTILVNGHLFDKKLKTKLSPSNKDMRFEVGVTDFSNLEEIKYQYFLEGYDKTWSDFTDESFKIYTNLNYGDYNFKVRAKNYYENISIPDNYSFSISPYWYQTKFTKFIFLISLLSLISFIVSYFSKRKFVKKVHELELAQKYENEKNEAILKEKERGLQAMIAAQEEERSKIARELHDGVVQQIGSVILKSRNLFDKKKITKEKEATELLQSLENSNQDLRNISHQMMPRALKELGIIPALQDLLDGSLSYANIKYSLEHFNLEQRLPEKIEVTIYRITQELINNIIKHSKAKEVSVQLFKNDKNAILIVEDNGVGFASSKSKKGIGLLNISSRLDMVKGDVNFEPSPNSGTLVTVKIPV